MAGSVSAGLAGAGFDLLLDLSLDLSFFSFGFSLTCALVGGGGRRGGCMCMCEGREQREFTAKSIGDGSE